MRTAASAPRDTLGAMGNPPLRWLISLSLLSGLVGAVAGAALTLSVGACLDQKEIKRDVLRRFAGTRYVLTQTGRVLPNGEPFVALNEAFIVFADHPDVLSALDNLRTGGDDRDSELVVALIKRMAAAANVSVTLDDAFIRQPMTPQQNR